MENDEAAAPVYNSSEPKRPNLCTIPTKDDVKSAKAKDTRQSNRIASYLIPPLLVVVTIFSTYVWFDVCIQWYIRNDDIATGTCLIFFQVILLALAGCAFFRITLIRAGYVPNHADRARFAKEDGEAAFGSTSGTTDPTLADRPKTYDRRPTKQEVNNFLQTRSLYDSEFYVARPDSLTSPRYCHICDVEKYDRVHHCTEVNRCVKKFDHFCPWVGGPLGHTRYKFFFQFITYVAIYCIFTGIALGVAVSQRKRAQHRPDNTRHIPANPGLWYACIANAAFFALMMVPFSIFHGRQIASNKSTLESIDTRPIQVIVQLKVLDSDGHTSLVQQRVTLAPGDNPFDLGWWRNWQQVLGPIILDRYLPFRILNWFVPLCGR